MKLINWTLLGTHGLAFTANAFSAIVGPEFTLRRGVPSDTAFLRSIEERLEPYVARQPQLVTRRLNVSGTSSTDAEFAPYVDAEFQAVRVVQLQPSSSRSTWR